MKGHISPISSPAKICLHCAKFQIMFTLSLCQSEEGEVLFKSLVLTKRELLFAPQCSFGLTCVCSLGSC